VSAVGDPVQQRLAEAGVGDHLRPLGKLVDVFTASIPGHYHQSLVHQPFAICTGSTRGVRGPVAPGTNHYGSKEQCAGLSGHRLQPPLTEIGSMRAMTDPDEVLTIAL
jgi:hypothetical protein